MTSERKEKLVIHSEDVLMGFMGEDLSEPPEEFSFPRPQSFVFFILLSLFFFFSVLCVMIIQRTDEF